VSDVGRFRRRVRPFSFVAGAPRPGRYSPDDLDILRAIEAIRYAPVEVGYGFDAEGRQVFRQVGDRGNIHGFDQRDLNAIAGGTFVHGHPPYVEFSEGDPRRRAGSFSLLDLVFMYEHRLAEIIAVSQERTYFLRSLPGGGYLDAGEIQSEYALTLAAVERELHQRAVDGIISSEEAECLGLIADETMARMSLYFDYRIREVRRDAS
jgi:hypothetical protein